MRGLWLAAALLCARGFAPAATLACPGLIAGHDGAFLGMPFEPSGDNLYENVVLRVLLEGDRLSLADVKVRGNEVSVQSPDGTYRIRSTRNPNSAYPARGLPNLTFSKGKIYGEVDLFLPGLPLVRSQGIVRSLFRADRFLHPHLSPGAPFLLGPTPLSYPERAVVNSLIGMERTAKGISQYLRGMVMPVGMGKTHTSAGYAHDLGVYQRERGALGWAKPPNVAFFVENGLILRRAMGTYHDRLGFNRFAKLFGNRIPDRIAPDVQMIAGTRTSYFRRMDQIHDALTADPDQPWIIVIDEAQHTGTKNGQFQKILEALMRKIDHRHRILLLSATLWHQDRHLIAELLQGNVAAALLTKQELALLRKGLKLPELCRLALFRAMHLGYVAPLTGLSISHSRKLPFARYLRDVRDDNRRGQRTVTVYDDLVRELANQVNGLRRSDIVDRGIFFVPTRGHANAYASALAEALEEEVWPFHGGEEIAPDTYEWFVDEGDYATATDRAIHKHLFSVDMLREGVSPYEANLIGLLRPYSSTQNVFANLVHNFGRGDRVAPFKDGFRVIDDVGFIATLEGGLGEIFVEPPKGSRPGSGTSGFVTVNNRSMSVLDFEREVLPRLKNDAFGLEFPYFDLNVFSSQTAQVIHFEANRLGVTGFTQNFGVKRLVEKLAQALPPSDERTEFLASLEDEETWGWGRTDGAAIKQGKRPVCERAYVAFHTIAAILQLSDPDAVDLSTIHEPDGIRRLFAGLFPNRPPTLDAQEDRALFLDEERGAFALLQDLPDVSPIASFERGFGARDGMKYLVERAVERNVISPSEGTRLLSQLSDRELFPWLANDGRWPTLTDGSTSVTSYNRQPYQRIYHALYLLAEAVAKGEKGKGIDPKRIHERAEVEKLLLLFEPDFFDARLTTQQLAEFTDTDKGAASYLANRAKRFGVPRFSMDFGARDLLLAFADLIPGGGSEKVALINSLKNEKEWGWTKYQGGNLLNGAIDAGKQFFRAFYRIAGLLKRMTNAPGFDLKKLHTREGAKQFIDVLLTGRVLPDFSKRLATFASKKNGGLHVLIRRAPRFGVQVFSRSYGARELVLELNGELSSIPLRMRLQKLFSHERLWGWKPGDGSTATSGEPASTQRILAAVWVVASHFKELGMDIDLDRLHTQAEMTKFTDLLLFGVAVPRLNTARLRRFRSANGAMAVLKNRASELGIMRLHDDEKVKLAMLVLSSYLPAGQCRSQLRPKLENSDLWGWVAQDWGQATGSSYYGNSCEKIYRAFYLIAVCARESGADIALQSIHEKDEANRLWDWLLRQRVSANR